MNMVRILEKLGIGVHYNPNQTCCGQVALMRILGRSQGHGREIHPLFPHDRYVVSHLLPVWGWCVTTTTNFFTTVPFTTKPPA
jgi:L-lactate dehydrogenase complex protein LldE